MFIFLKWLYKIIFFLNTLYKLGDPAHVQKTSIFKTMRNPLLKIPVTTAMTILGFVLVLILFAFAIVGLLCGALKEIFYFISSSQGFSTKTTSFDSSPANVLITQE